ncbi:hypothetical protein [Devosia sp.]|uniref:hypothetical protein n=1 Tax=Devosia sp. TaxID=1871048 RepID=UPI0035B447F9
MGSLWRAGGLAALLALAGCASLSLDPAARPRPLDHLDDDIASLLLVFDLPASLEPVRQGSVVSLDFAAPADGGRHIRAALVAADASDLADALPPPADGRSYYFFGFSGADQASIRAAQEWARALPPGNTAMTLSLSPGLCRTAEIDPARVSVSVLVALPGASGLAPLLADRSVEDVLAAASIETVPACDGHSG